ncbi:MAG: class I SAM-dependent rRNA methyltransferase [Candidatus Glassbacteria bacterium]
MKKIYLKRGREKRILGGHPWIYRGEILRSEGTLEGGEEVSVLDYRGKFIGRGFGNPRSIITIRVLAKKDEDLDEQFFLKRLEKAKARRHRLELNSNAIRLVFSEADGLPGLIVDRYDRCIVVQFLTLGMDIRKKMITGLLQDVFSPISIYERSDVRAREHEGLKRVKGDLVGKLPPDLEVYIGKLRFFVDALNGQKTGLFLDQRENAMFASPWMSDKDVLDCFSYTGSFGLQAVSSGARHATFVEISEEAVEYTKRNIELNKMEDRTDIALSNAFDVLKEYDRGGRTFDVVILDPPSFTRSKKSLEGAKRGYKEINLRALRILRPGGMLVTSTCSQHLSPDLFQNIVREAAQDARVSVNLIALRGQAEDHPVLLEVPETRYLTCLFLRKEE